MLLIAAWPMVCARGEKAAPEEKVKAGFVFNFIEFTKWPAGTFEAAETPIVVGFAGETPIEEAFRAAAVGTTVNGRAVVAKQVHSAEEAAACQVVVFAGDDGANCLKSMGMVKERGVLTIGDSEGFTDAGGVIRFYVEEGKERFEVNALAAERADLQISSKLLKLAKIVRK